jgi:hypothetical protein
LVVWFQSAAIYVAADFKLHPKCRIASRARKNYPAAVKHSGKAALAGLKLVGLTLAAILVLLAAAWLGEHIAAFLLDSFAVLIGLWAVFAVFTFYFFRDPNPLTPTGSNLVISPGHGTVFHGRRMPAHLHLSLRV